MSLTTARNGSLAEWSLRNRYAVIIETNQLRKDALMATAGKIIAGTSIYNPVTHERITFLRTSHESPDGSFVFDCQVTPGGATLPPHIHTTQRERFTVVSGTLGVMLGSVKQTLSPGETIDLPARIKHQWWNAGDEQVHFRVEVRPARNLESVLRIVSRLACEGKLSRRGVPSNPFLLALFAKTAETYLPGIPFWMQDAGMTLGCTAARLLGYDRDFADFASDAPDADASKLVGAHAA